ncbi:MAG: radical SAM protein [Candidatus Omnitrophota bacterium]|nr:B12-binding domain-containing radical SAM protein [Candidatus Omnitrophota bacterium]
MIALSKKRYRLRIVNPAYPAFNIYSHVARLTTALGPVSVASVVNEMDGWDVEVIDENNLRLYGPMMDTGGADHEFLQHSRPADIVGLYGGLTSTIPRLYEIARFYKAKGVVTITGGQHFFGDNITEALKSGIDYVVIGEGEETIKEFIRTLISGGDINQVKGLAYLKDNSVIFTKERPPITDFDNIPLPDFSLVRYAKIKIYPVSRIRGCGMDCEFCTVKGKPRCSSPERLLEKIQMLLETRDARFFFIVDDLFGQARDETIRFCNMLRDYQIRVGKRLDVTVQIRLDKAKDSELLHAMRQASINTVAIGFETPIEEELKAMNKRIKPQDMIALARIYHRFGFLVHGMFIFGYPVDKQSPSKISSKDRVKIYKKFIKKAKIDTIQVLLPVPLPGTQLRKRLQDQGRIYSIQDIGWEYYDGNFPTFEPDESLTAQQLQLSIRKIMSKFYKFKYLFEVGFHLFSLPAVIFFLHNIRSGWRRWYRVWRNNLIRFGGWIIVKGWTAEFNKSDFFQKLKKAQDNIKKK